ncbi:MAG: tagaturonate epimerase family protein [Candidatus Bipolaricaulaceae bacterium]
MTPSQPGFEGVAFHEGLLCPLSWNNAQALSALFGQLKPRRLPPQPSFGFGDRLGLATSGHLRAVEGTGVFPVLAQQSMRENARTGRTFADVLTDAIFGAFQAGWTQGFGADADHLKSVEEARRAARLGYTLFTCDPSDFLEPFPPPKLPSGGQGIPWAELEKFYLGRNFSVPGLGKLRFQREELRRIAGKYWRALEFAEEMHRALREELPHGFDFELSVDETPTPTTTQEHLFLALELRRRGVELASLAPRFPGALEKAVDYRGNLEEFRQALRAHVAIAQAFGPYRLSLHSGSDKWSLYPIFAAETGGLWHVKTAGTSYLVALEVLARASPTLFREIMVLARARFPEDRQGYHVHADPEAFPPPQSLKDHELPQLLTIPEARQILHVTYGSVLQRYGEDLKRVLSQHEEEYHQALAEHFGKHLRALGVKGDG